MKLEISAAVVGLFAAVISGAAIADPAPKANGITHALDSPSKFAKRGIVYLKVCTDANFEGRCQNLESQTGQCYGLYNGFNDQISSLGPLSGNCIIWVEYGCTGATWSGIVPPGIYNLGDYGLNDKISSYLCLN